MIRVRNLALAAALLVPSVVSAQVTPARRPVTPATQAPAARATLVTSVEGITEYSLPNGLRVLLFPDQSKQTVTVNVTYMVGSTHEGFGETGMAHLLEHLVFKGSKNHVDMQSEFTKYGARRNGSTSPDRTNYYETVPASDANLEWALDLEADRMVNAFIAKKDLESEFSVVRNELEAGENEVTRVMLQRVMRAAYRWHGYGRSTIGTRSDIENVPIDRLQAFYRKYYQPDNAILIVAGRFDPAKTLPIIERKFGSIPRPKRTLEAGNLLLANYTVEPTQDGEQVITVRRVGDAQMVMIGYHIPAGTHPDFAAIDVLSDVLSSSPSGRLYKAVVDTKKAASIFGGWLFARDPSLLIIAANVRKDQSLDSARAALEAGLAAARTATYTAEEVERAKTALLTNIRNGLNNSEGIGLELSEWAAMGDWRMLFLRRDRVAKVTPADVQRVAQTYLKPANSTIALYIPTPQPDRAEIPAAPNVASMLAGYKGGEVVAAGEAFDASPKNIDARTKRAMLPNGMQLILLPKLTRGNRVNAQVVLRHGSEQSLTGKAQIGSLTSGMLNRGTTTLSRQQIQDSIAKLGSQVSWPPVGGNTAIVNIQTTRPNLAATLDLVAQQLKSPKFDAEELDKLKKERLAQLEQVKSEPAVIGQLTTQRKLMPKPKGHPLYQPTPDELIAEITAVTADQVKAFHQSLFGASFADLSVVGDFDEREITAVATRLFGDWKNPQPFARLVRTYAATDSSFESIETPDKQNATFYAATNVELSDADPDYPAFLLGNMMLGQPGQSSRLWTRLREKEGLSYDARSIFTPQSLDRYGTWIMSAIYAPQNVQRLQIAFREELDRALKDGFTQAELDQFRAGLLQGRSQGRANDPELVGTLVNRRFAGRTMAYDEELEKKIAALTPDQVNAALRKYLDPKKIFIVRAGDFAKNPPTKATP